MNHKLWHRTVAAVIALSTTAWMADPALAQTPPDDTLRPGGATEPGTPGAVQAPSPDRRASRLIGMDVRDPQGQDLGEINDLVIDVNNQRVHYAILGFGGFLGLGEKLFAYPLRALRASGDRLVLDVPRQRLASAPGFERNRWPDWADPRQRETIDRHHGIGAAPGASAQTLRLVRASELLGKDVNDLQGGDAGEIDDLVVNLDTAQVRYVVLDFDKAWSPDDKLLALPLGTLRLPAARDEDAVLQVPRDRLDMRTGFDDSGWPDLNDAQTRARLEQQLQVYQPWASTPPAGRPGAAPQGPTQR